MFPFPLEIERRDTKNATERVVIVAVKAEKMISKTALAWTLTHVVHPGDCITLLAVFSKTKTGKRFWNFPRLTGDCSSSHRDKAKLPDRICEISESCSQMVLQFHDHEVGVRIKVVSGTSGNVVAAEAKNSGANWVVLDKKLKQELRHCIEELRCNIVVMKGSQAKVLRLNLGCSEEVQTPYYSAAASPDESIGHRMKHSTPVSSPEETSTSYSRTREGSLPSYDSMTPLYLIYEQNPLFEGMSKGKEAPLDYHINSENSHIPYLENRIVCVSTNPISAAASDHKSVFWIPQNHMADEKTPMIQNKNYRNDSDNRSKISRTLLDNFVQYDQDARSGRTMLSQSPQKDYIASSSLRNAVPLGRTSSMPPPLCSICQHKAPVFGKPPGQFSYTDLEEATQGFSDINFLAEGGFGNVYRGVLRDGQVVAVKLLKSGGSQADTDFCREVRVLSCAQHRNVVLLIGFCIEGKKRILVYEYICNGSLDFHSHGNRRMPLDWYSRMKIAIGTARGLRYLHEDCRVGCIVHRDMRPNNILVTHDFEPLVADFGLARWHSEWNMSTEDRVIGTIGYLAPEYVECGQITHKVDVYAFGVVLLELMTGQRINELQFFEGQHFLSDWFHPLAALEPGHVFKKIYQLLDPSLATEKGCDFTYQLQSMVQAASLCLRPDPESRPPMSKVLRILEGGDMVVPLSLDLNSAGNRSGHLLGLSLRGEEKMISHSRKLSH